MQDIKGAVITLGRLAEAIRLWFDSGSVRTCDENCRIRFFLQPVSEPLKSWGWMRLRWPRIYFLVFQTGLD